MSNDLDKSIQQVKTSPSLEIDLQELAQESVDVGFMSNVRLLLKQYAAEVAAAASSPQSDAVAHYARAILDALYWSSPATGIVPAASLSKAKTTMRMLASINQRLPCPLVELPEQNMVYRIAEMLLKKVGLLPAGSTLKENESKMPFSVLEKLVESNIPDDIRSRLLAHDPALTTLDLSECKLTTEQALALAHVIADNPHLTSLNLTNTQMWGGIGAAPAIILAKNPYLKTLNLSNNQIGPVGAAAFAENTQLKTLILSSNSIGNAGAKAIANNKSLITLDVSCNYIDATGVAPFAENTSLRALNIRDNQFGAIGATALASNAHLIELDVSNCDIRGVGNDDGVIALAGNTHLKKLTMKATTIGRDALICLARNTTLRLLNLGYNDVDDVGLEMLKSNIHLTTFVSELNPVVSEAITKRNRALYSEAGLTGATVGSHSPYGVHDLMMAEIANFLYGGNQSLTTRAKAGANFFRSTVVRRLADAGRLYGADPEVSVAPDFMEIPLNAFVAKQPVTVADTLAILQRYIENYVKAKRECPDVRRIEHYDDAMHIALTRFTAWDDTAASESARLMHLLRVMQESLHCKLHQISMRSPLWRITQVILRQQLAHLLPEATLQNIQHNNSALTTLTLTSDQKLSRDDADALTWLLAKNRFVKTIVYAGESIDVSAFIEYARSMEHELGSMAACQ